jgi:hypothetical protein
MSQFSWTGLIGVLLALSVPAQAQQAAEFFA